MEATATSSPAMSLSEIRAKLEKAKLRRQNSDMEDIKDKIREKQEDVAQDRLRERSLVAQIGKEKQDISDINKEIDGVNEHEKEIIQIGDDPKAMLHALHALRGKAMESSGKNQLAHQSLLRAIAEKDAEIEGFKGELSRIQMRKANAEHEKLLQGQMSTPAPGNEAEQGVAKFSASTYAMAEGARPEIRDLFAEVVALEERLKTHGPNLKVKHYFAKVLAGKIKVYESNPTILTDAEEKVCYRMLGAMRGLAREYECGYVEALDTRYVLQACRSWGAYSKDAQDGLHAALRDAALAPLTTTSFMTAERQFARRFQPRPMHRPASSQSLARIDTNGNVRQPDKPRVETNGNAIALPVLATKEPPVLVKAVAEGLEFIIKPKPEKESMSKKVTRLVKESGILAKSEGMRVAVMAGGSGKNEQLRLLVEGAFKFKSVRWYDKDSEKIEVSLKAKGIDLLIGVPEWHKSYPLTAAKAKQAGITALRLRATSNKALFCRQIVEGLGFKMALE